MKGRLPAVGSIVLVTWEDAHVQPTSGDEMPPAMVIDTIGWLVAKDRRAVLVSPERLPKDAIERWRCSTRIRRADILAITRICSGG